MSNRAQLERLMIGSLVYFVRDGDTVDALTVSETAKPDNDPVTNWPKLGEVTAVAFDRETKKNEFIEIRSNGEPRKRIIERTLADYVDISIDNMVDIVAEMIFGVDKITINTAQVPFNNSDRAVTGWLKCQLRRSGVGTDFTLFDMYVEARLKDNRHEFKAGEPYRPTIRFQDLNAALDTINFPV